MRLLNFSLTLASLLEVVTAAEPLPTKNEYYSYLLNKTTNMSEKKHASIKQKKYNAYKCTSNQGLRKSRDS